MKKYILIFITIIIGLIFIMTFSRNKTINEAVVLMNKSKLLINDKDSVIKHLQEAYINSVFFDEPILVGSLIDTLNHKVQINELLATGPKILILVSKDQCINCIDPYINLLHKYFNNRFLIVRLGNLADPNYNNPYPVWTLLNSEALEKIVQLKQPLITLMCENGDLQYSFMPRNSNLIICDRYLSRLKDRLKRPL